MAGAAATSALFELLFDKLASGAIEQFGRLLGVRRDLDKLKSNLSAIQAVIEDAEERAMKEKAVRDWMAKLRDAAYDADDLLDEFQTEFERRKGEIQQHSSMFRKVRIFFFSSSNPLAFRINMSSKIKAIAGKLDLIAEERSRYQLRDSHTLQQMGTIEGRMTAALIDETEVYGRDDDLENIVKLLLETETDREELSIVTIVGMGGLGKTTLAQLAFNHERVVKPESFDSRIWVCVSHKFDIKRIGRAIIEFVTNQKYDLSELASVADRVQQILAGKKFLLVLDDVWNENEIEWEELRKMLLGGAKGSKTIITTRSDRVASIMGTNIDPYHLGRLLEDDCWKLFEHRAFKTEDRERDPSLEAIGREIVAKCGGSPLAAKALGSLMRFKRRRQEWLAVRDSNTWISTDEGDRVMVSLRLSYNHLSPRLKQCFAYCSIFPKDSWIDRDELILQWIAQGFIPSDANSHAIDVGNEYFNNLVMMSFLEKYSASDYYYKMHDLVHELIQSVAGDEYFIRYADQKKPAPQRCRFFSLVGTLKASELKDFFQESKKTRALRLYNSQITNIIMFTRLQGLRVLDIGDSPIKELHGSINRLKHLRSLTIVVNKNISELPKSIGELRNLQALIMSGCSNLRSLPKSFTSLHRLVTLNLTFCSNLGSLPESLDSLQSLHTLSLEGCSRLVSLPESIGNLANLRTLRLGFNALRMLPQSLSNLSNLEELGLRCCNNIAELPEGMANMTSLRHLKNKWMSSLKGMPSGVGQLRSLVTLDLFVVGEDSNHSSIAEMKHLNLIAGELELTRLENVKSPIDAAMANLKEKHNLRRLSLKWCDSSSDYHHSLIHEEVLAELMPHPNLETLHIVGYAGIKFPNWLRTMGGSESGLPNLVELTLSGLKCLLSLVGLPPCLKKLSVGDANSMTNISRFPLLKLEELWLYNMSNLEKWSASVLLYPRLVKLEIRNCPKLHAEPWIPASVEDLTLKGDVGKLLLGGRIEGLSPPSSPPPLLRLRKLTIYRGSPDVWNGLQYICSATLKKLVICYSSDMVDLPEAIRCFASLRVLWILYCPNLTRLPEWLADLTSLKVLLISGCSRSLQERCEKDTGEEWPKIAHIPQVYI